MTASEKRVAALEAAQGKRGHFASLTDVELTAHIDRLWAKLGTTHAEQVAHYGSEKALLRAVRESVGPTKSNQVIPEGINLCAGFSFD